MSSSSRVVVATLRGLAYTKLGRFEKALEAYEKAIEIKPDFDEAYYSMGIAYTLLNEFDKALEAYEKSIVLNSALIRKLNILKIRLNLNGFFISLKCLVKLI
jgi:tetratricopeptide (TPR) repeat protein